jgi:transcriptional regulator with XRE-family HTH domain
MVRRPSRAGVRLRDLRREQGWSQEQLARVAGIKRSWVQGFETGTIQEPGAADLLAVAKALGVAPEYLLHGLGEPPDLVTFTAPPAKAGPVRWLLRLTGEQLATLEDVANAIFYRAALGQAEEPEEMVDDVDVVDGNGGERHHGPAADGDEPAPA